MALTGMFCLEIYYALLVKELERDCLEHHCEISLKLRDW